MLGLFADEISKMAGAEEYSITPRKGEYLILINILGISYQRPYSPLQLRYQKEY